MEQINKTTETVHIGQDKDFQTGLDLLKLQAKWIRAVVEQEG